MSTLTDEARYWATKAADAHHNMLDTIQNSAGKWQIAIAAFLGVYSTAGFIMSPDKLDPLPVRGWTEASLLATYGAAGVCGISAIILASLASARIPQILTGEPITGSRMRELVTNRAKSARRQLKFAVILAL